MNKKQLYIGSAIVVVFAVIALLSICKICSIQHGYQAARETYQEISDTYMSVDYASGGVISLVPDSEDVNGNSFVSDGNEAKTDPEEATPLQVDFEELMQNTSSEVVGWIWCPDTVINYPIVQHSDNEFYLNADVKGNRSHSGAIFLEYVNFNDFSDRNNIIHGHHMNDGSMFATLDKWQDEAYLQEHPVMYLNTVYGGNYKIELFAAFTTPANSDAYRYEFNGRSDILDWIWWLNSESKVSVDLDLAPTDRFLTLSTCDYSFDNARALLIGRMAPVG